MMKVELVADIIAEHGEGPVWDPVAQKLYWVDLLRGKYFKTNVDGHSVEEFTIGQPLGFLALRKNQEGLVMGVRDGFGFYDETKKHFRLIEPSPEQNDTQIRFNDGAVDPMGRFFGGTMEWDGADNMGKLFRLNTDHSWDQLDENFSIPNGMGWNIEKNTFYIVDSNQHALYAYDYNLETGGISNKKTHIQFPANETPDGMCIDAENGFWIAMWGGSKIMHFDQEGKLVEAIAVPVLHPTSCCFGGKDKKTLFITSSKLPLTDLQKVQYPLAGKTFKVETETVGQKQLQYNG